MLQRFSRAQYRASARRTVNKPKQRLAARLETLERRLLLTITDLSTSTAYPSIQAAISGANPGDTILVSAGTYAENVTVNKMLVIEGAQHGVDARSRSGPETVLDGTTNGGKTPFYITANDVTIDGFTVQGATDANQFGFGIVEAAGTSGAQIVNNILQNNIAGLSLANNPAGNPGLIQHNLFQNNNEPGAGGGNGIYTDQFNAGGSLANVSIDGNSFLNDSNAGVVIGSTDATKGASNLTVSNNTFDGDGNALVLFNTVSSSVTDNTMTNSTATQLLVGGGDNGLQITNNLIQNGAARGIRVGDFGGGSANQNVTINYNNIQSNTDAGLEIDSAAGAYTGTLDASRNWWGDVSGPTIAGNVGGAGQTIVDPNHQITFAPWLIYGTDADPTAPGFQLPTTVPVASLGDKSAAVNDFTLLQNAIGAAATGQTIDLSGPFDWTATNAAAADTTSNATAPTDDIRGVALPDGVNNLTITSSAQNSTISGVGDSTDGIYNGFVFSAVASPGGVGNNQLTISNLKIDNFMSGVMLGWNNGGVFNGTLVQNNTITVAADNDNSPNDAQGIAVYFWNGQNQTMTGNTIDFEGDGTRTVGTGARSYGFQDGTTGGTGYNGLSIDHNIFQLLPSAIGGSEVVTGIWENGHNDDNASHISIADNQFLGIQGKRQFDIGLQLSSQTANMAIDGNTFTDVKYVYWVGTHNGDVPGDQFTFTNNVLTRVGDANGVFLQNQIDNSSPADVITVNWGTNSTIDGFTGIRGLNELSTQATGQNRPSGAATDLDAVVAFGPIPADYVNANWGSPGRFTNPLATPDGTPGPIAFGFNTFTTIQDGVNAVDAAGTVNVLPGTYAENVSIDKNLTLTGLPTATIQPAAGDGITVGAPATDVTVENLAVTGAANGINASNLTTLNLSNLTLTGNTTAGGTISNVSTVNDTPLTGSTGATDTITGNSFQRNSDDVVNYSGVTNLNVIGSDGSDTFDVTPAATTTTISVDGGLPTPPATPGDTLDVNLTGLTSPSLTDTLTPSGYQGHFTFGNALPVNFQNIETLANIPNLSITKTDNSPTKGFVVPGTSLTYTIVVSNAGPGTASGASVTDNFPADFTGATYTATATGGATGFTANGSGNISDTVTLPAGSTITYLVIGTVDPTATGTLANQATVTVSSPIAETSTATDSDALTPQTDLSITKTDNSPYPGHVFAGTSLTYSIVVSSSGPSAVTGASVTDTFPANFTGAIYTATATGGATGFTASGSGDINDTVNMPAGSTITYVVMGTVAPAATGTLSNTAAVTAPLGVTDTNPANNSDTDTDTVSTLADISITKTDNSPTPSSVVPGTSLTYTIVVTNSGPSDANGATVTDTFPADFTGATYTASATGGATGFSAHGSGNINDTVNLPAGSKITYTVLGTVSSSATGTLSNKASVMPPANIADTNLANNSDTDTDTLTPQADITITKTDNSTTPGSVVPGTVLSYTITVGNSGPSVATATKIADVLPAGFSGASFSSVASGGATGNTVSGSGNINDILTLPSGSSVVYTVSGTIDATATGTLKNTAAVTPGAGVTDTNTTTSATDSLTLTPQADIVISKTDNSSTPGSAVPGTALTYTITVGNSGPSVATATKITDVLPAGFTGANFSSVASGGATGNTTGGSGNISDTLSLPAGGTVVYTVTGTIDPAATGTLSNTAMVTPGAGVTDTNTTTSDTDSLTLTPQAMITITKADNSSTPGSAVPGTALKYTITVGNSGPSVATATKIADALPAGFTGANFSSVAGGGATGNTVSGSGNISDTLTLPVGGSVVYTVTGTIGAAATGTLANTATVTPGAGVTDTNTTTSDTDSLTLTPQAKITITKIDSSVTPGSAVPGTALTYRITVGNSGPSVATATKIADVLPAGFTGASFSSVASGGAIGNTAGGTGNISDTLTLPVGSSVVYTVTGTIDAAATGTLANTVTVVPGAGVTDTNSATSATDSLTLTPQANITITKTDNSTTPGSAVPGTSLTYTITVGNSGPSVATATKISDALPAGFIGASFSSVASGGATGNTANSNGNINDTLTLPSGSTVVYTVTGTIDAAATGTLKNTAAVAPGAGVADTNSTTSVTDSLTLTPQADIRITKTDNSTTPGSAVPGTALAYTITVGNSGPSLATATKIADGLPAGFTAASFTSVASGGATGNTLSGTGNISDTLTLPSGSLVVYTVTGTIDAAATGTLANTVTVTPGAGVTDTNSTSSVIDRLTLKPQASITIIKTDNSTTPGSAVPGTALTYTITVGNSGPSVATATKIADVLPAAFTAASFSSVASGGATGNTASGSGNISDTLTLPSGSLVVYTVTGTIDAAATGTLANTVTVTPGAGVTDTNATTSATDSLTLKPKADIVISKTDNSSTPGSAVPGTALTYTITVGNSGPSVATATKIADVLPTGFTATSFTSVAGGGATGNTASGSGNISNMLTLPSGSSVVYTVKGTIDATATGTLKNTATVTPGAGVTDTNATTSVTDSLTLKPQANITITKTDNSPTPGSAVPGSALTYTITVGNSGPSVATATKIADVLPAAFTAASFTSVAAGGATGNTASGTGNISDTLTLPSGSSVVYKVTGTISASATGTLANTATVTLGAGVTDTNATSIVTDSLTLKPQANITIAKTDNSSTPGSAVPGTALTYTITVGNSGPSVATATRITDDLPTGFTAASFTSVASGGATGNSASGSGNINDTLTLPSGGSVVYTLTGTIGASATGTLANTATVTPGTGVTDTNATASATDSLTLKPKVDLSITKTDGTTTAVPRASDTYTIVVANTGPSDAIGATVSDSLPAALVGASFTATATGGATGFTAHGSGNIGDTVNLPAGSSITYVLTGTIKSSATGSLSNSATVTAPAGVTNTNPVNSATDTDTLTPQADVTITKTDNSSTPGSVVAGGSLIYTIVVANAGPSDVTGASVTDTLPADFSGARFTATASGGASGFTAHGSGNISDTVNLPAGGSITYVASGTISPSATGNLSNTATVAVPAGVTNTGAHSATDSDTISAQAGVTVTKSDSAGGNSATSNTGSIVAGRSMAYIIVVSNSGPGDVTGASIADTFPTGFTDMQVTDSEVGGAKITSFPPTAVNILEHNIDLPAGSSITFVVTGTVSASATGSLSNTANVTLPAGVTNTGNLSATDTDTITTQAGLTVTKTDNKGGDSATGASGSVSAGTGLTYTIVVSNSGPSDLTGAAIADSFPSGFAAAGFTATATGGATGFTASGSGNISDTVNLPVGSSITYVVSGTVGSSATGSLSNTASVTLPAGATNSGNLTATDYDTIVAPASPSFGYLAGAPGDGTAQTFVQNLYRELLGREPDSAGDTFWVGYLAANNNAAGRQAVVESFLNSDEYKARFVTTVYQVFLGRVPDAPGLQFWSAVMSAPGTPGGHSGSADEAYVLSAIVGSDEFYARAGGTDQGFAQALYQDLLGRSGDSAGIAFWSGLAGAEPSNRDGIVRQFLSTPESEHLLLDNFYPATGGTAANPLPAPGTAVVAGADDLAIVTGDGWENLYLEGAFDSSPEANDAFFADLASGTSWDDVQFDLLTSDQFYNNPNRPVTS